MIITISRQFGAGGSAVAARTAAALGWSLVDNEIVDQVALRAGLSPAEVAQHDERVPTFVERLSRTLAVSSQEFAMPVPDVPSALDEPSLVRITQAVVKEAASHGRVVLVGRAAPVVLGQQESTLHVRLVAPLDFRIRQVMDREQVDAKHAEKMIGEIDVRRAKYHREYYDRDWEDPLHYQMVLNVGVLGVDAAAALVVFRARQMGWK
jgi:cytidylate kinase